MSEEECKAALGAILNVLDLDSISRQTVSKTVKERLKSRLNMDEGSWDQRKEAVEVNALMAPFLLHGLHLLACSTRNDWDRSAS